MTDGLAGHIFLTAASWNILWVTWATTRPERPASDATPWQMESFGSASRQFHLVMAILSCGFLFVLAKLVGSLLRA